MVKRAIYSVLGLFGLAVYRSQETTETIVDGWVHHKIIPGTQRWWIGRG